MVGQTLILGARTSPLSRAQVVEALPVLQRALPDATWETRFLSSIGDRDLKTPLESSEVPADFFTRDLDERLLSGEFDLCVHSAKDLPSPLPAGLVVAALRPALDIRDALVFREGFGPDRPPRVVGTSSVARRAHLLKLFPGAEMKSIRGTIQGRLSQLDAGEYDAVVIAACALDRLGLAGRIGSYLPFDPAPQQSRLAFVVRADDARLIEALKPLDVRRTAGLVALVGCPADEALLPRRARTYLEKADIIVHDRLVPNRVLEDYAGKLVNVGKTGGDVSIAQSEIHRRLLAEAEAGKLVVRLHGGDPGIFGHLGETLDFLSAWNIRFDIVPAVTSAQAAAARARAALTHRDGGRSIILMSGHSSKPGNPALVTGPEHGNMAIYMGAANRAEMGQRLLNAGWPADTPVQVCQNLGYDQESVDCMTLADLPAASVVTPAVMLVGTRPVPGIGHTLFTGTDPDLFLRHGPLIHWPFIRLENTPLVERAAWLREHFSEWDGVIFPSRFAVASFLEALLETGDTRELHGRRLLAVGPATAEALRHAGLRADAAPRDFGGVASLARDIGSGFAGRYLYPCSDASPTADRVAGLKSAGIELRPHVFYRNLPVTHERLPGLPFSRVLFTSGSTVRAYFNAFPAERAAARTWLAVGPSTLAVLASMGLKGDMIHAEE